MKKAQVTVFIIIAILIVSSILFIFLIRNQLITTARIPEKLTPFTESYSSCLQTLGDEAVMQLGQRAGYINFQEQQGSSYMPFGNSLAFLGDNIPYWFYISGNGLEQQQVPTNTEMEKQLQSYIESNLGRCDYVLTEFAGQGFNFETKGNARTNAVIRQDDVALRVTVPLSIEFQGARARIDNYDIKVTKALGKTYDAAKKIMDAENKQFFLEERTIDTISIYNELPSTTTSLECNPKNWQYNDVKQDLQVILANNIQFTKIKGTNYAEERANPYYEIDADVSDKQLRTNFIFIENPFKLDINGQEQGTLKGDSINQLEAPFLRNFFCLTSYDFVYTIAYPVLITVYDEKTDYTFKFPIIVFVDHNKAREAAEIQNIENTESQVCNNKLATETVFTFDEEAKPLENVFVNYQCINTVCEIGTTTMQNGQAVLQGNFPQCINGFVIAEKQGYAKAKQEISTNVNDQSINLNLKSLTTLNVELKLIDNLAGERTLGKNETAIITFIKDDSEISDALIYPDDKNVELVDGLYNVRVLVFKKQPLTLEKQSVESCVKVPAGVFGVLGITKEKCQTIEVPETEVDQAIFAGTDFQAQIEVKNKKTIIVYALEYKQPESIDEMNSIFLDITLNKDSALFKQPEVI